MSFLIIIVVVAIFVTLLKVYFYSFLIVIMYYAVYPTSPNIWKKILQQKHKVVTVVYQWFCGVVTQVYCVLIL